MVGKGKNGKNLMRCDPPCPCPKIKTRFLFYHFILYFLISSKEEEEEEVIFIYIYCQLVTEPRPLHGVRVLLPRTRIVRFRSHPTQNRAYG